MPKPPKPVPDPEDPWLRCFLDRDVQRALIGARLWKLPQPLLAYSVRFAFDDALAFSERPGKYCASAIRDGYLGDYEWVDNAWFLRLSALICDVRARKWTDGERIVLTNTLHDFFDDGRVIANENPALPRRLPYRSTGSMRDASVETRLGQQGVAVPRNIEKQVELWRRKVKKVVDDWTQWHRGFWEPPSRRELESLIARSR